MITEGLFPKPIPRYVRRMEREPRQRWLAKNPTLFFSFEVNCGQIISAYLIQERTRWCRANCSGRFNHRYNTMASSLFHFTEHADAMAFALRWK